MDKEKENTSKSMKFHNPQINLYVKNVEQSVRYYTSNFGFIESFRTPKEGTPIHVELTLDNFILGLALIDSIKEMHGLDVGTGQPRGELVIWTDDVDEVFKTLTSNDIQGISKPHTFLGSIRSAWIEDPDKNPIQIVSKVKEN